MLSPLVARALAALDFHVAHVHGEGQPPKGSKDAVVLDHVRKHNQIVVTNNYDMIVLCAEREQPLIWLGARRGSLTRAEMVMVCFSGIEKWQRNLAAQTEPVCLRAYKTTTTVMSLEKASQLAQARIPKPKQPPKRKRPRMHALGPLFDDRDQLD